MRNESWLKLLGGFVLVGVFAAGALFGAGLIKWTASESHALPPPPPGPGGAIAAMTHELQLDSDQVAKLEAITAAHRGELDAIARDTQGRVKAVLFAIEDEMRASLRPDQIKRLEDWRMRRPPPPPPPGMPPPPPPP
jgi:hypothetical protein